MRKRYLAMCAAGIIAALAVAGCSKPVARCVGPEDNPEHHYLRGMEALETGKLDVARAKFERSTYCDEKYAKGHAGLAIVAAAEGRTMADPGFRNVAAERADKSLAAAKKYAGKDDEMFDYYVAAIRVNTLLRGKGWLENCEDAHKAAGKLAVDERRLVYYQGTEAATYFMAVAYLEGLEFQKARDGFAGVLSAKREGKWHEKADKGWKRCDKIVRAMAGITVGDVGKKIAVKESVTRADLAAYLIDEMKINKLFAGRIPVEGKVAKMQAEFTPADTLSSPFKEEILEILKWKVRGLEPKPDQTTKAYLFFPDQPVLRGELAFILEDVLMKLTGDEKIATAYFGQDRSPFPDVKTTSNVYNAVMNMTTRSIMESELSGEFRVDAPVDGAELVLAVRVLRQKMNIY